MNRTEYNEFIDLSPSAQAEEKLDQHLSRCVTIATAATAATVIVMKRKTPVSTDTGAAFMNMSNGNF